MAFFITNYIDNGGFYIYKKYSDKKGEDEEYLWTPQWNKLIRDPFRNFINKIAGGTVKS